MREFETPEPQNILQEADLLTMGDRQRDYDHPWPNHERIAGLWNAYFEARGHDGWLEPQDIVRLMILLKLARQVHKPTRDNLVDIAGYARCEERMDEREQAELEDEEPDCEREPSPLEEFEERLREISGCPPDTGLEHWVKGIPGMLHVMNELRCEAVPADADKPLSATLPGARYEKRDGVYVRIDGD